MYNSILYEINNVKICNKYFITVNIPLPSVYFLIYSCFIGKAHGIALHASTQSPDSEAAADVTVIHPQPGIKESMKEASKDAYKKLFNTAYNIAIHGKPFIDFEYVVQLQKENGVKLLQGKQNDRVCAEMIDIIKNVIQDEVAEVLASKTAFSILFDGSQPKKTGSEMELVYVRVVNDGVPVYYCVGLQEMAHFGGANAEAIKEAVDDVFGKQLKIDSECYKYKCVSVTGDGASVNTGVYGGVFTLLGKDRPWLLKLHCVEHRAELSAKDAFNASPDLREVDEFYVANYNLLKNSGKLKSEVKATCEALNVTHYPLTKIHGTRFQHHHRRGLDRLIHMWIPLQTTYENALSRPSGCTPDTRAKMKGFVKKFKSYAFLTAACTFQQILQNLGILSKEFEKDDIMAFHVKPKLNKAECYLNELHGITPEVQELNMDYFESLTLNDNNTYELKKKYPIAGAERKKKSQIRSTLV